MLPTEGEIFSFMLVLEGLMIQEFQAHFPLLAKVK